MGNGDAVLDALDVSFGKIADIGGSGGEPVGASLASACSRSFAAGLGLSAGSDRRPGSDVARCWKVLCESEADVDQR
ncbi:hypothetical protein [Saccharopolyspora karakumensis]|uniref:hypothetical protein n=1 Tax=Saccharopolyspora karakumensis TaxID=2530386 RepID=UPI0038B6936C